MVLPSAKSSKKDNPYMIQIVPEGREKGNLSKSFYETSIILQLCNKKQTRLVAEGKLQANFP